MNSGNGCAWKPWNGAAGPFAVRRWLRPTGNWTAPDPRRQTARRAGPVEAIRAEAAAALSQALGTFQGVTGSLEDDIAAEAESDRAFLAGLTGAQRGGGPDPAQAVPPGPAAPAAPAPNSLGFTGTAAQPARDYANPPRLEGGNDPPGWERIYEGSFLEAVLVTQLSGDFPGPVLAQVATPFYSADRQRVLVPRGARVIGTASAVQGQDQERLAV